MRFLGTLIGMTIFLALNSEQSVGQGTLKHPARGAQESYKKHQDTRFGNNSFYPDRGAILDSVPKGATIVNYAGLAFHFFGGVWYEPRGAGFMVVAPPIGLIIPSLPTFATLLARNGQTLIYCNDVYYRPRPDVNGYEVVNDPAEPSFQVAAETPPESGGDMVPVAGAGVGASAGAAGVDAAIATAPVHLASQATPLEEPAKVGAPVIQVPTPVAGESAATPLAAGTAAVTVVSSGVDAPSPPAAPSKGTRVSLEPRNGQGAEQQARDRYDCYRQAVSQSGFDPMRSGGSQSEYEHVQSSCLESRGYTVR